MRTKLTAYLNSMGNGFFHFYVVAGNRQLGCGITNGYTYDARKHFFETSGLNFKNVTNLVYNY